MLVSSTAIRTRSIGNDDDRNGAAARSIFRKESRTLPLWPAGARHIRAIKLTVQLSFKRDGSIFGKPRINYVKPMNGSSPQAITEVHRLEGDRCVRAAPGSTPLVAANIAGQVFVIRFIAPWIDYGDTALHFGSRRPGDALGDVSTRTPLKYARGPLRRPGLVVWQPENDDASKTGHAT